MFIDDQRVFLLDFGPLPSMSEMYNYTYSKKDEQFSDKLFIKQNRWMIFFDIKIGQ